MRRFPATQRAIAAEVGRARLEGGYKSARALSLAMGLPHNFIWLIETNRSDASGSVIYAICKKVGLRAATFWARVERRLTAAAR